MDGYNGRGGASNARETAGSHGNIKGARDGENYEKNEVMVKKKRSGAHTEQRGAHIRKTWESLEGKTRGGEI